MGSNSCTPGVVSLLDPPKPLDAFCGHFDSCTWIRSLPCKIGFIRTLMDVNLDTTKANLINDPTKKTDKVLVELTFLPRAICFLLIALRNGV